MDHFATLPDEMLLGIMEHMSDKDVAALAATSKRMQKLAEGPLRKAKLQYFYSKGLTDEMLEFLNGDQSKNVDGIEYEEPRGIIIRRVWRKGTKEIRAMYDEGIGKFEYIFKDKDVSLYTHTYSRSEGKYIKVFKFKQNQSYDKTRDGSIDRKTPLSNWVQTQRINAALMQIEPRDIEVPRVYLSTSRSRSKLKRLQAHML